MTAGITSEATVREVAPNLAPPPGNPRFPLFDSLRAIAALCVFLGHTVTETQVVTASSPLFVPAVQLANQGVAIFFLISGFLLYRPFVAARVEGRKMSIPGYARRRILRIVPAYWVALSLFVVFGLVNGVTWHNWWIFYGFYQIYVPGATGDGLGVAWTLCVEVTFYAALPVFAFVAMKFWRGRRTLIVDAVLLVLLSIGSLVFRAHFDRPTDYLKVSTLPGMFTWFALGMGLAVLSVAEMTRSSPSRAARFVTRHPNLCWIVAVALAVLSYVLTRIGDNTGLRLATHMLYDLVALFVLLPAVFGDHAGGLTRRALRWPVLVWVGLVSYAVYLYHSVVIMEVNKLAERLDVPGRYLFVALLSLLITCLCAAASYYVVERPAMRLRFGGRARPAQLRAAVARERSPEPEPVLSQSRSPEP